MKALVHKKYGDPAQAFKLEEVEKPIPATDEILIKVQYSGINFADVLARVGLYDDAPKPPNAILGYDVSGIVESVGANVNEFKVGDKVAALTRFGGYAEFALAKAKAAIILANNYDMALATALATQACTAYYCAEDLVTLHKAEKVLIQAAAGGVGSILVQIAKHRGCEIFATCSTSKVEFVKSLGANHIIDYTKSNFEDEVRKIAPNGLDVVFDSLGGQGFKKGYKLLRPGGKMVCFGVAENIASKKNKLKLLSLAVGFGLFSPIPLLIQSKSLIMVNMLRIADHRPELFSEIFKKTMKLAEEGIIRPHLGKIFDINEFNLAHEYLETRKSIGKIVLKWHD